MKQVLIAVTLLFSAALSNAQTKKVLWLGNSYIGVNALPVMTYDVALSLGDTILYDSNTPGGYTLQGHSTNATTLAKIAGNDWDVVVMQEQSQRPSFPDWQVQDDVFPYAEILVDSIFSNNECTEPMFYMTWGRKYGDQSNCGGWPPVCTRAGMFARLRWAYLEMAFNNDASAAPVGQAWENAWMSDSTIDLWSGDLSHPSIHGSYLAACTFYASIYRESPVGAAFPSGISAGEAVFLQGVAEYTVLDSLDAWNIGVNDISADFDFTQQNGLVTFTDASQNGLVYSWDFGDGTTSTDEDPTHTYTADGTYTVTLTVSSDCGSDTFTQDITIVITVLIEQLKPVEMTVYPNPVRDNVTLKLSGDGKGYIALYDITGKEVLRKNIVLNGSAQSHRIDVSTLALGIYEIQVKTDNGYAHTSLLKR
jgi:hypothetical protein